MDIKICCKNVDFEKDQYKDKVLKAKEVSEEDLSFVIDGVDFSLQDLQNECLEQSAALDFDDGFQEGKRQGRVEGFEIGFDEGYTKGMYSNEYPTIDKEA